MERKAADAAKVLRTQPARNAGLAQARGSVRGGGTIAPRRRLHGDEEKRTPMAVKETPLLERFTSQHQCFAPPGKEDRRRLHRQLLPRYTPQRSRPQPLSNLWASRKAVLPMPRSAHLPEGQGASPPRYLGRAELQESKQLHKEHQRLPPVRSRHRTPLALRGKQEQPGPSRT